MRSTEEIWILFENVLEWQNYPYSIGLPQPCEEEEAIIEEEE